MFQYLYPKLYSLSNFFLNSTCSWERQDELVISLNGLFTSFSMEALNFSKTFPSLILAKFFILDYTFEYTLTIIFS